MSTVIGVLARDGKSWYSTTLRAVEDALPVRFEPRQPGDWDGLSGLIVLGQPPASSFGFPALPCLHFELSNGPAMRGDVVFAQSSLVPSPFRGRRLVENVAPSPLTTAPSDEVLASCEESPVWIRRSEAGAACYMTSAYPEQMKEGEGLRDLFCAGRFFSLLPLLDFVHLLLRGAGWERPALRASFMFDDPNLHWTSYGYIDFDRIARHASRHGYHVASAMVPRDMWYARRDAADIFRENRRTLSLLVHGNNHVRRELGRSIPAADAAALARQAMRRTDAFEHRTGIPVARVMAAPHGTCSEEMLPALRAAGFEAICIGGRQPWLYDGRAGAGRRWHPADVVHGLPVMPRIHFDDPWEDILFRAFLGQPLIVYGHHTDLARGLELLEDWSARLNDLGDVQWLALDRVARGNVLVRHEGAALHVRVFARRADVVVPDGVDELVLELPSAEGEAISVTGAAETVPVAEPGAVVRVRVKRPGAHELRLVQSNADSDGTGRVVEPFAFARRVLAEARDRALPLLRSST